MEPVEKNRKHKQYNDAHCRCHRFCIHKPSRFPDSIGCRVRHTKVGPVFQVLFAKSKRVLPDSIMQIALRMFYKITSK